ncbi:MAG: sodium:proton antiporter NhaD [Chlamydia sp.]
MTICNESIQSFQIIFFLIGYLAIIFEHAIHMHKTVSAILMAVILWGFEFARIGADRGFNQHLADVSQIFFFLLASLTIVEQIYAHGSLSLLGKWIKSSSGYRSLWLVAFSSFFMSALLDNLTTTIVMIMVLRRCFPDHRHRSIFSALVVMAANAGGTWTPIGDVTTTMLWMGGKLSTIYIMKSLLIPSLVSVFVSSAILCRQIPKEIPFSSEDNEQLAPMGKSVLVLGSLLLLFVPICKHYTGLPPFMGMMFALALMWFITDQFHGGRKERDHLRIPAIFSRIDLSGIFFFFGILLSINALDSSGILKMAAIFLQSLLPTKEIVAFVIGIASAIIDNIPLVAATMGMYDEHIYPLDSPFWSLIAYCAGTGGSIFIIGSAAGLAFMSLEGVSFMWYIKKASFAAFIGYSIGFITWVIQNYALTYL